MFEVTVNIPSGIVCSIWKKKKVITLAKARPCYDLLNEESSKESIIDMFEVTVNIPSGIISSIRKKDPLALASAALRLLLSPNTNLAASIRSSSTLRARTPLGDTVSLSVEVAATAAKGAVSDRGYMVKVVSSSADVVCQVVLALHAFMKARLHEHPGLPLQPLTSVREMATLSKKCQEIRCEISEVSSPKEVFAVFQKLRALPLHL